MRWSVLTVVGALVAIAVAVPAPATHVQHEKRDYVPKHWIKRDRVHKDFELPMRIGLTQSNLHKGEELLMEV